MTTPSTSKRLTIFEGPDGSGKSTAAQCFAELTGARYVHFPALPSVGKGQLARLYVEAMLPALLGYQDVVFDRCWLSEVPYGQAFRGGLDRLGPDSVRMLERLALRCGAVVIQCQPPVETCIANFLSRKGEEYLKSVEQLRMVYDGYTWQYTTLPRYTYDYTQKKELDLFGPFSQEMLDAIRTPRHDVSWGTAGNLEARVVLVGEGYAERKSTDSWYQWPFASFSNQGCSQWVTAGLRAAGVVERKLLWANADDKAFLTISLPSLVDHGTTVVALGGAAWNRLQSVTPANSLLQAPHPQNWKRFHAGRDYPLLTLLKEVIDHE